MVIAIVIAAAIAAALLVTWSLCRAAALGDEIAANLNAGKERSDDGE